VTRQGTDRPPVIDVRVQAAEFDPGRQLARLGELRKAALASFVGRVEAGGEVVEIRVDHHAALARSELQRIGEEALARWPLAGLILIHRQGRLQPGDRVLFAAAAASDADISQQACTWLVAQIRARAPFWRKDVLADGTGRWFLPGGALAPADAEPEEGEADRKAGTFAETH
jgi:molybdopterin synthase catalytic subunit